MHALPPRTAFCLSNLRTLAALRCPAAARHAAARLQHALSSSAPCLLDDDALLTSSWQSALVVKTTSDCPTSRGHSTPQTPTPPHPTQSLSVAMTLTEAGLHAGPGLGLAPVALLFQYMRLLQDAGEGSRGRPHARARALPSDLPAWRRLCRAGSSVCLCLACRFFVLAHACIFGRPCLAHITLGSCPTLDQPVTPLPFAPMFCTRASMHAPRSPGVGVAGAQGHQRHEVQVGG
jgi:hypothetical protein